MKKALLFIPVGLLAAVGVSTLAFKTSSFSIFATPGSGPIVPGTITLGDGSNPTISVGLNSYKSSNQNDFQIYCNGIAKIDDVYSFSDAGSYIENHDALHGIYQIDIYAAAGTGDGYIRYGYDDAFESKGDLFELSEGICTFAFDTIKPNYFYLSSNNNKGLEPILFTKMVIYYSCSEEERVSDLTSIRQTIDGYDVSTNNTIILEAGSNLADIPLGNLTANYSINLADAGVTDVEIKYTDDLLKDSTTVVEGVNDINISFRYGGYLYTNSSTMTITGYDHFNISSDYADLMCMEYRIQAANTPLPEDFVMSIGKAARFFDSSDNNLLNTNLNKSGIEITNEMIVDMDADAFTARGDHEMTVNYLGTKYTLNYGIYDPEYNNIRSIYISGTYDYEAGTPVADVIADLVAATNHVSYYENDPDLPESVTLTASNFDTTEGMFDNPGYVEIPIHYQNYVGSTSVRITVSRGNFVKTYTNDPGLFVMGTTVTAIHLYDNGYCEFNDKGDERNDLFAYTLVDGVLSITAYGNVMKFDVEDVNDTFAQHVKEGTILYNLKVNFHALGAEDAYNYDGIMYDDNTIVFNIMGMTIESTYTVDLVDSNVIYFNFTAGMLYHCKGTIDTTLLQMLVEEVAQ